MNFCPKCGAPRQSKFCTSCGHAFEDQPVTENLVNVPIVAPEVPAAKPTLKYGAEFDSNKHCGNCGSPKSGTAFCTMCGKSL